MEVISTRRYEARPPATIIHPGTLIDHENPIATVKEEEWETRKKKEITTTRQIQTRVKRQVVLEDGEVIKDSGPLVTTNTTEDIEQQEHTTQEKRKNGDDKPKEIEWNGSAGRLVQKELNETVVKSREEVEELLETEDRRQFGDITDEAYQQAVRNNNTRDLRHALAESSKQLTESGPRVIQHTTKSSKVIDTEEKHERNELKADGAIVTETKTSVTHEEIRDTPDHVNGLKDNDEPKETRRESSQKFIKKRNEDIVDYVLDGEVINREMRYVSETTEGNRVGDWPPPSTTMRTMWLQKPNGTPSENDTLNRKDALTKKPLDPEQEDEARKFETSKWLESHFGSESRSSHGSIEHDIPVQTAANTSFINVTMKSCIPRDRKYKSSSSNSSNLHYRSHQQSQSSQQQQQQQQPQHQQQQQQQPQHQQHHQQQSHHQRKTTSKGTGSGTSGGYFHGISEWSERYQTSDKQNNNGDSSSPSHCIIETQRSNGYNTHETPHRPMDTLRSSKETGYIRNYETTHNRHEYQQRTSPPSPPIRRRVRQQVISSNEDKNSNIDRGTSPVQVIQRTWEKRNRDIHDHGRSDNIESRQTQTMYSPTQRYRSTSPVIKISLTPPLRRDRKSDKNRGEKSNSNKRSRSPKGHNTSRKSKIGESFRKLVDKLRSASTERNNKTKKSGISSTSQLTQTDDSSTYLQYNVIDRNIPEINKHDEVNGKIPERPPRSPRNSTTSPVTKTIKVTRLNGHIANYDQYGRNDSVTPVHRYYIEEAYTGRNTHDRNASHGNSKKHGRTRIIDRDTINNHDYNIESTSLGRFSKSASRLANDYERDEQFTSTQTLPRKLHMVNHSKTSIQPQTLSSNRNRSTTTSINHHNKQQHQQQRESPSKSNQSRHYGSMINISIKNAVNNSPIQDTTPIPAKPERTYKSSLSRSKSFNVLEANTNGTRDYSHRTPFKSNTQLNRLDETPPLKSPGILASINRSNRDLFKAEY